MCTTKTQTCALICRKSKTQLTGKIGKIDVKLSAFENNEIDKRLQLEMRVIRIEKHARIPKARVAFLSIRRPPTTNGLGTSTRAVIIEPGASSASATSAISSTSDAAALSRWSIRLPP
jgi:hypothetical protein